jgi:hypothetical protein
MEGRVRGRFIIVLPAVMPPPGRAVNIFQEKRRRM